MISDTLEKKIGEMNEVGKEKYQNYKPFDLTELSTINDQDFDAELKLITDKTAIYLELNLNSNWVAGEKRKKVNTSLLGKAIVPDHFFENADGSPINIDDDYLGNKRNTSNPSPGPFEICKSGKQNIRIW